MADDDESEGDRVWDEYDWERFLQQQDRKTERYMELLEKYLDDPNRDQIIAREMGWFHLLDADGQEWMNNVDNLFAAEMEDLNDEEAAADEDGDSERERESFEMHPLYQMSFSFTVWLDKFFDELGSQAQNLPAAVRLTTQSAIASAKLAAALSDDGIDEVGMTIAYLKRSLKAVTNAMEAAVQLRDENNIPPERSAILLNRIFQIRDGIIELMGQYRTGWKRDREEE